MYAACKKLLHCVLLLSILLCGGMVHLSIKMEYDDMKKLFMCAPCYHNILLTYAEIDSFIDFKQGNGTFEICKEHCVICWTHFRDKTSITALGSTIQLEQNARVSGYHYILFPYRNNFYRRKILNIFFPSGALFFFLVFCSFAF